MQTEQVVIIHALIKGVGMKACPVENYRPPENINLEAFLTENYI